MSRALLPQLNHLTPVLVVERVEPCVAFWVGSEPRQRMKSRTVDALQDIPNVGPSIAGDLRLLGVNRPHKLVGKDPYALYDRLCKLTGERQDPCVIDVFIAAVRYMEGAPARPWWHYTKERKRRTRGAS